MVFLLVPRKRTGETLLIEGVVGSHESRMASRPGVLAMHRKRGFAATESVSGLCVAADMATVQRRSDHVVKHPCVTFVVCGAASKVIVTALGADATDANI